MWEETKGREALWSKLDRWGTQAHLAGRASVTRWAGTLFYFPG